MQPVFQSNLQRFRPNLTLLPVLLGVLLGWLLCTTPAWAETSAPPADSADTLTSIVQGQSSFDASGISSEKINQFVQAYLQVVALIERREGELQSAETETESRRIERDIEAGAFALIEQAGLTRQEYLQLLGLANTDPEFGERIAAQLQEAANF